MLKRLRAQVRRLVSDERGYVLPLVAVSLPVIFGGSALAVDYGYVLYVQEKLQASTDQAALAGAKGLTDGTYTAKANLYSSSAAAGGVNLISGISIPAASVTVTATCSTTMSNAGVGCPTASPYNAIKVTQTAQVPLFFGKTLGFAAMTVKASSYASGGGSPALNVMVVMDTTGSMNDNDPNYSKTSSPCYHMSQLGCSELGLQSLLSQLNPNIDFVGLQVFPGMLNASITKDYGCSGKPGSTGTLTAPQYLYNSKTKTWYNSTGDTVQYGSSGYSTTSGGTSSTASATQTYTIVPLSNSATNSYRASGTSTTLNSSNTMVQAAGYTNSTGTAVKGCLQAPGYMGTFYSDAISQAQASLTAFKTSLGSAGVNTQNVIILLSDGDAYANPNPSTSDGTVSQIVSSRYLNQCHQAITAASTAKTAGTLIYVIAFGAYTQSSQNGCRYDSPSITPYCALAQVASNDGSGGDHYFFSDSTPPSSCTGVSFTLPAASTSVAQMFQNIGSALESTRLIPSAAY